MKKIVPVYPWPMHQKVSDALAAIPDITPVEANPGGPGPILAIVRKPPFVADVILVSAPERVAEAVNIVTRNGIELVTIRDTVTEVFGEGVVETFREKKSGVRFQ